MGNTSYAVTITSDHQLIVNDTPVAPPEGIHRGDSEALLAWALDRVSDAHADGGGVMILTIRDHREGGYGTSETVMQDGEDITIEDLRRRTGKDLSAVSVEYDEYDEARDEAQALADEQIAAMILPEDVGGNADDVTSETSAESDATDADDQPGGNIPAGDTPEGERAAAAAAGRPFYPFDLGVSNGATRYDPLALVEGETTSVAPRRAVVEDDDQTPPDAPAEHAETVSAQSDDAATVESESVDSEVVDAEAQGPDDAESNIIESEPVDAEVIEADQSASGAEDDEGTVDAAPESDDPTTPDAPVEEPTSIEGDERSATAVADPGAEASDEDGTQGDDVPRGPLPFKPLDDPEDEDPTEKHVEEPALFAMTDEERAAEERAEAEARDAAARAEVEEAERKAVEEAERKRVERERHDIEAEVKRAKVEAKIEAVARKHAGDSDPEADTEIAKKAGLVGRLRGRGAKKVREKKTAPAKVRKETGKERVSSRQAREIAARDAHAKEGQEVASKRGWIPLQRQVPRPHVPDAVVRQRRSRPWMWALLLVVLVGVLAYRYYMANEAEVYAAVCVDERTMTREVNDAACKDRKSPPYNRWLYVPRDGTVPPVDGAVDLNEGSFDPPTTEATITYGFADEGGLVGGQNR